MLVALLLWTLRLLDELPNKMCLKQPVYEKLAPGPDLAGARTHLRLLEEIAAMLDFYYCLHWHLRDAGTTVRSGTTRSRRAWCSSAGARGSG
ncbi:MAG TPA: DUF4272 domain-containing protein [Solirubrobacteraceae bacterium]